MRAMCRTVMVVGLISAALAGSVSAAEMTIAAPTDDVYIWTAFPNNNYNGNPENVQLIASHSYIGPHDINSLLRFDLSAVPDGAVVTSATLHMYCLGTSNETAYVYRMAEDGWDEDTVTWNSYSSHLGDSTLLDARTITIINYDPSYWEQWNITGSSWATDLADNMLTLMVKAPVDSLNYTTPAHMASQEYTDAGGIHYVPYLTIEYVPEPATMGLLGVGLLAMLRRRAA